MTAVPTQTAKAVSDVYGDNRYNNVNIGGWKSYPGIKKFLDDVYQSQYPTHDISHRDALVFRLSEMYLIQAECQARLGNTGQATSILTDFVKTYRDPSYDVNGRGLSLANEIWFQRRIELWGEGFFMFDAKRLGKPVVRFHGEGTSNEPTAFAFNIDATDGWLNMRFPQDEMDNNTSIIDNTGGEIPKAGQNPNLRDGVTD
jgi:hypothetical protein